MNKHVIRRAISTLKTITATTTSIPKYKLPTQELQRKHKEQQQLLQQQQFPTSDQPQIKLRYANNPTELIIRIQKLCERQDRKDRLELAIRLVKSSSIRVATISVWTELFKLLLKHKKFSISYKLFLEIKRRNVELDLKFFHFYFHLISQSPKSTKNYSLDRLESIWYQAQTTMKSDKSNSDQSMIISLTNSYLNCLCSHGFIQHAFDQFHELPSSSIDTFTIHQISKSLTSSPEDLNRARNLINHFPTSPSSSTKTIRNSLVNQVQIDLRTTLHLASLFFKSHNQPTDSQFGSKILEDRLGLKIETNQYQFWNKSKPPLTITTKKNNNSQEEEEHTIKFNPGQFTTLLRMLLKIKKFALVRRLWYQIIANRDLHLERNSLDQTHCGLVMIALGKCNATVEVESLLAWMIKSGDKRLKPTLDTLDKAIQAAWQTEDLTSAIIILSSLTQTYEGLIRPGTTDSEHELVKLSKEKRFKPIERVSNRTLCTILQTAGKIGIISEINRTLMVIEQFDRRLPERKSNVELQLEHQEKEKGLYLSSSSSEDPDSLEINYLNTNSSNQNLANLIKIEKYWFEQYIWVLTDLLDKILSRKDSWKVIEQDTSKEDQKNSRLEHLRKWRKEIDEFLASDLHQFRQLRSRIEVRANERLLNKQKHSYHQPPKKINMCLFQILLFMCCSCLFVNK